MDETGALHHDNVMPPPLNSPSSFTPYGPAPRGVLKHSISQDSESSMETLTKRVKMLCLTVPPCGLKFKNVIYSLLQLDELKVGVNGTY